MTLTDYQTQALTTSIYPDSQAITYPVLGLVGEAGELANQWKKVIRDDVGTLKPDRREKLIDECGDVLWYLASLAFDLGTDLETIAARNLAKLQSRQQRGTLGGSGDAR